MCIMTNLFRLFITFCIIISTISPLIIPFDVRIIMAGIAVRGNVKECTKS